MPLELVPLAVPGRNRDRIMSLIHMISIILENYQINSVLALCQSVLLLLALERRLLCLLEVVVGVGVVNEVQVLHLLDAEPVEHSLRQPVLLLLASTLQPLMCKCLLVCRTAGLSSAFGSDCWPGWTGGIMKESGYVLLE